MNTSAGPDPRRTLVESVSTQLDSALIALDFDGTLAPLVLDPTTSRLVAGAASVIATLAGRGAQIAVVTGRDAMTVLELSGLHAVPGLQVHGLYGAEQWQGGELSTQPDSAAMAQVRERLPAIVAGTPGTDEVWIEDKRLSLVVHTRRSGDPQAVREQLREPVAALAQRLELELHDGHAVLEVRLPGYDKAKAVQALIDAARPGAVLFCGDDLGDQPAFDLVAALRAQGTAAYSVLVGPGNPALAGAADVTVETPADLVVLLREIAGAGAATG